MPTLELLLIALAWIAGIGLGLFLLSHILAWAGGWKALAKHYPDTTTATDAVNWLLASASLGWVQYNNCLRIGISQAGLHIRIPGSFLPAHPPLLIPWPKITETTVDAWWLFHHVQFAIQMDTHAIQFQSSSYRFIEALLTTEYVPKNIQAALAK
jgi:hypothetical protein